MSVPEVHDQGQLPHCIAFAIGKVASQLIRFKYQGIALMDKTVIQHMEAVLQHTPRNEVAAFCDEWNRSGPKVCDHNRSKMVDVALYPSLLQRFDEAIEKAGSCLVVVVELDGDRECHAMATLRHEAGPPRRIPLLNSWGALDMVEYSWTEDGHMHGPRPGRVKQAWGIDVKVLFQFVPGSSGLEVKEATLSAAYERQQERERLDRARMLMDEACAWNGETDSDTASAGCSGGQLQCAAPGPAVAPGESAAGSAPQGATPKRGAARRLLDFACTVGSAMFGDPVGDAAARRVAEAGGDAYEQEVARVWASPWYSAREAARICIYAKRRHGRELTDADLRTLKSLEMSAILDD